MSLIFYAASPILPLALTAAGISLSQRPHIQVGGAWCTLIGFSGIATVCALANSLMGMPTNELAPWLKATPLASWCAVLVQLLGTVIASFSARYLDGEPGQRRYALALGGVLMSVQLLLLADHWLILVGAWALVGVGMQPLLCFYRDRPFALLAGHKKWIADRAADALLMGAAAIAWQQVGSGAFPALWVYIEREGMTFPLHLSALCLALAVVLRTALLPVHGWLIQVMEAPTPVSALLHAGVVNLGGFVLIRFAPLLNHALPAQILLVAFGLGTAILAGLVMLTRISVKVRLAWSTVAQMGFMVMECGLGLYTLAALHLIGHSLYKAHTFLSASDAVRQTRLRALLAEAAPSLASLALGPAVTVAIIFLVQGWLATDAWPWWWSVVMGLSWAPLLWLPAGAGWRAGTTLLLSGLGMIAGLSLAALLGHALPLGLHDAPAGVTGIAALAGMMTLYLFLAALQVRPRAFEVWRRWAYAGFYLDEIYTRIALRLGSARWIPAKHRLARPAQVALAPADFLG